MQASSNTAPHSAVHAHDDQHAPGGFWGNHIFSTDHTVVGIQYGVTALLFMLFGFSLMLMMRWQIAHPGEGLPILGPFLHALLGDVAIGVKVNRS